MEVNKIFKRKHGPGNQLALQMQVSIKSPENALNQPWRSEVRQQNSNEAAKRMAEEHRKAIKNIRPFYGGNKAFKGSVKSNWDAHFDHYWNIWAHWDIPDEN